MYLVRKACETHGILGKILLIYFNWGRGIFENTTSQIEKTLSLFEKRDYFVSTSAPVSVMRTIYSI